MLIRGFRIEIGQDMLTFKSEKNMVDRAKEMIKSLE
jgi:hypothetical protein